MEHSSQLDIYQKKKLQEDIYKCSQNELKKIVECLLQYQNTLNNIKYTKNIRGYFFNINTIPDNLLKEIQLMVEYFGNNSNISNSQQD